MPPIANISRFVYVPGRTEAFHRNEGQWVREVVLGANDGLVSILALVAGVAGAATGKTVLIAGIAGVLAGAISMGLGAFVAGRSYSAFYRHEEDRERWEMENLPDVETEEIRKIYRDKGFEGAELEQVVRRITGNPEVWLEVMMREELGLMPAAGNPFKTGMVMFGAFVAGGIFPVVPFFFAEGAAGLAASIAVTAAGLMAAGVIRSKYTGEPRFRSGLELMGMAGAGVGIAYLVGLLVGKTI